MTDSVYSDPAVRSAIHAECERTRAQEPAARAARISHLIDLEIQANRIADYQAVRITDGLITAGYNNITPSIRLLLADYEEQRGIARAAASEVADLRALRDAEK